VPSSESGTVFDPEIAWHGWMTHACRCIVLGIMAPYAAAVTADRTGVACHAISGSNTVPDSLEGT